MEGATRTIDELVARYTFAPDLAQLDVYVEGSFDVALLRAFLRELDSNEIVPYEIDAIDIPAALLEKLGLTSGKRQKVVALASELALQKVGNGVAFLIADLDEEQLIGIHHTIDGLHYTDETAMELYVIDEKSVERFVQDFAGIHGLSGSVTISIIEPIARELFLARAAAKFLHWSIDWIDIGKGKYVSASKRKIAFDLEKYLSNCLTSSGKGKHLDEFSVTVKNLRLVADKLSARCFRGHDFAQLLHLLIRANGKEKAAQLDDDAILRALLATKQLDLLQSTSLFSSIVSAHQGATT